MVIFLHGLKGSGKDTIAKILVEKGFEKVAFADPIKVVMMKTFKLKSEEEYDNFKRSDFFNGYGLVSGRHILRSIGMLMRHYNENQFVEYVKKFIEKHDKVVVTDLRFDNELEFAKSLKNKILIKVKREVESDNHITEKQFDDDIFDYVIENNGTLEELAEKINNIKRL